jgi:hypothetical protein
VVLRRSTRLLLTLGVVAALLVAGGISAASLLSHKDKTGPEPAKPMAAAPLAQRHTVSNPEAKLSFDVPPDWELADEEETLTTSNGIKLGHLADWGSYTCQGAEYGRAFAASGVAPNDRKPGRAASELAASVAADQYSDGHQTAAVKVSRPQATTQDGAEAAIVQAEATLSESADRCAASKGTITVVAVVTPAGNSVLVVGADATAGPEQPTPLAEPEQLKSIVSSLRIAR